MPVTIHQVMPAGRRRKRILQIGDLAQPIGIEFENTDLGGVGSADLARGGVGGTGARRAPRALRIGQGTSPSLNRHRGGAQGRCQHSKVFAGCQSPSQGAACSGRGLERHERVQRWRLGTELCSATDGGGVLLALVALAIRTLDWPLVWQVLRQADWERLPLALGMMICSLAALSYGFGIFAVSLTSAPVARPAGGGVRLHVHQPHGSGRGGWWAIPCA